MGNFPDLIVFSCLTHEYFTYITATSIRLELNRAMRKEKPTTLHSLLSELPHICPVWKSA